MANMKLVCAIFVVLGSLSLAHCIVLPYRNPWYGKAVFQPDYFKNEDAESFGEKDLEAKLEAADIFNQRLTFLEHRETLIEITLQRVASALNKPISLGIWNGGSKAIDHRQQIKVGLKSKSKKAKKAMKKAIKKEMKKEMKKAPKKEGKKEIGGEIGGEIGVEIGEEIGGEIGEEIGVETTTDGLSNLG